MLNIIHDMAYNVQLSHYNAVNTYIVVLEDQLFLVPPGHTFLRIICVPPPPKTSDPRTRCPLQGYIPPSLTRYIHWVDHE